MLTRKEKGGERDVGKMREMKRGKLRFSFSVSRVDFRRIEMRKGEDSENDNNK